MDVRHGRPAEKGLHLHIIHNLDRSFSEMMLGLESHIPMYMTGQISPYYLKNAQNSVFHHFLKVSGSVALSGEAIVGHHAEGRYHLTSVKSDVEYYTRRANDLLRCAKPLMDIYREDSAQCLRALPALRRRTPRPAPEYPVRPAHLYAGRDVSPGLPGPPSRLR